MTGHLLLAISRICKGRNQMFQLWQLFYQTWEHTAFCGEWLLCVWTTDLSWRSEGYQRQSMVWHRQVVALRRLHWLSSHRSWVVDHGKSLRWIHPLCSILSHSLFCDHSSLVPQRQIQEWCHLLIRRSSLLGSLPEECEVDQVSTSTPPNLYRGGLVLGGGLSIGTASVGHNTWWKRLRRCAFYRCPISCLHVDRWRPLWHQECICEDVLHSRHFM